MIRVLCLVAVSFLIVSCGGSKEGEKTSFQSIQINLDEAKTLKASDHFKLKDIIYFSDSLVVDNLMKVSVHNDYLVLHCGWGLDYLLIKNMITGNEILISEKGEGPNQYQELSNFFINPDGQIELLDGQSGKILTFDLEGNLKSVYQNELMQGTKSLMSLNGEDYFLYGGNFYAGKSGYQMQIWNRNKGKVKASYLPFDEQKADFMLFIEPRNFSKNPASFYQVYNQHVYELIEDGVKDSLYLDFGQDNIPAELLDNSYQDVREFSQAMAKSGYAYGLGNFLLEEDLMFALVRKKEKDFHVYTNTKTGESTVVDKISNDVFGLQTEEKIGYQHRPIAMNGNHIYFIVSLEAQNENLEEELIKNSSKSDLNQTLLSKIQNFEDGDNLAIVKCEINGF
ncbi:6-bladed beta-propeller [Marivirga arenosa]|uniref:6-bladed beta-propeller n=1 Tax=Marivirga arenosa TaxID=3059076 RepID=A0AA52EZF8_9BACT|nr:6-bladed beta-propeller [Marivirga sp. BKB1-2]WNB17558.1 6-bladed beta-propeller [Marivirga sp. BKB1-2]